MAKKGKSEGISITKMKNEEFHELDDFGSIAAELGASNMDEVEYTITGDENTHTLTGVLKTEE